MYVCSATQGYFFLFFCSERIDDVELDTFFESEVAVRSIYYMMYYMMRGERAARAGIIICRRFETKRFEYKMFTNMAKH